MSASRHLPRIVPTRHRMEALQGLWELEGERVRLTEDPDTGVLLAMNGDGSLLNPLPVISRGRKVQDPS